MSNSSNKRKVAVLGGGLAGLSAARTLIGMGFDVTLVEKRPFLGGRAFSFYSRDADMEVDNGQHVFMGCCTYYIDFLRAINAYADAVLQDSLRAEVVLGGIRGTLCSSPALGPFHLVPSFMRYPHIGARDKFRALFGLLKASLTNRRKSVESLDSQTFYDWLKSNHQSERTIENLWNLIILPTLNDDVRSVNADMALMVVQQGLLKKPRDAAIGYARVGLGSIAVARGRRFIEDSGGSVIRGKTVLSLLF
ncbi:MAG: NAD(P)-binding protein, partial [Dehalococcoidia bacterium]|nr:NAD(P)-binding protein [Dehalococcoidia bacterium]